MKFLVKIPSRSRPEQLHRVVAGYLTHASNQHEVKVLVSIDDDDATMTAEAVRALRDLGDRVEVVIGTSGSKIKAMNRDVFGCGRDFDVLIGSADDMVAQPGWDHIIAEHMMRHFPNLDGGLHLNDGHRRKDLCTLPVLGVNFAYKFDYIYHPDYTSLWCDNEQMEIGRQLRRLPYVEQMAIEHAHHTTGKVPMDEGYRVSESFYQRDHQVYLRRSRLRAAQSPFAFGYPVILLSICICSIENRREMRAELLRNLNAQVNTSRFKQQVEIVLEEDAGFTNGGLSIGAKRNRCLDRALGRFVVFIDDDDAVAENYVELMTAPIAADPNLDVVGMEGVVTWDGERPQRFTHSIKHGRWFDRGGEYFRTPNHWNPIRLAHAKRVRFLDKNWGEDRVYSDKLARLGILRRELYVAQPVYFYRHNNATSASIPE